ncbi:MAG TPA: hypothetical protein VM533_15120 [Fimbriiglobus sp.]|jgi:hypothetical protein|nr:hypothetical protein [Fimbriiglobus sp.]
MRRPWKASGLMVLVCAAATGCLFRGSDARSAGWYDRVRSMTGSGLAVRTVLIERPAGDPYLSRDLWASAGKPLSHEQSALLARNGLRVGVLTGMVPGEFEQLVTSEQAAVNPMHRTMQPSKPKVVPVNGPLERCSYRAFHDLAADPTPSELFTAECGLSVTVRPGEGDRVTLVCEPQVQHGDKQAWLKPSADGTEFTRRDAKPLEAFPTLSFEVTLGPQDYLLVGPADEPADTLGQAFFYSVTENRARQRVLVIRALRGSAAAVKPEPTPR